MIRQISVKLIQRRTRSVLVEKHPALEPPRQRGADLVTGKGAHGDGEDVVEFFEGALFGLGDPEEDHDESEDVHATVREKSKVNKLNKEGETERRSGIAITYA